MQEKDSVLVQCRQAVLAYAIIQVAKLKGAHAHATYYSETDNALFRRIDSIHLLSDRANASPPRNSFTTDAADRPKKLQDALQQGGQIVIMGDSARACLAGVILNLLSKGITIELFDQSVDLPLAKLTR